MNGINLLPIRIGYIETLLSINLKWKTTIYILEPKTKFHLSVKSNSILEDCKLHSSL